eukprot:TRINITY_DN7009_c0_g1_i1.p1 TRINITY_DN7009_c0_g1~~TRINITY_DN7009_c0_g1_i1.p1  ORF type:complete len:200 (-),score=51.02 TRINITY_DN7009_c0_g1_i1:41-640(-)
MGLKHSKKKPNDKLTVDKKKPTSRHGEQLVKGKVIFVGDAGVGKTAIIERVAEGKFTSEYVSFTPDFKEKIIAGSDGRQVSFELWDTAGQERFRTITSSYYRGAHIIFLVCDLTVKETIGNVDSWRGEADKYASDGAIRVLLANKLDLADKRVVSTEELKNYAEEHELPVFELSAKTSVNVIETFQKIADMLLERGTDH